MNDTGSWIGGFAPGSNNIIQNSWCILNCKNCSVNCGPTPTPSPSPNPKVAFNYFYITDIANADSGSQATIMTITWDITFKTTFTGTKNSYLSVIDYTNFNSGWKKLGTVAINYAVLIDPKIGGEVTSLDGKAKLMIPQGAFDTPQYISVTPLDVTKVNGMAPENYSLLVAIHCEPAKLNFLKPVELILKLDNPEIPGTLVRLGRCGEGENTFIPLGRTSPVAKDGYTLNFTLVSFSSYAGLSSMLSQGAPIGSGVQIPLPDMLTGSFSHSIPITVPPGRKGLQPNVALQYRSSNPNSWVGMGWSLNPGYIVRSTKLGVPTYDDTKDTFIFVTDSGSTELTHLIDNLYQSKIESTFAKFFKETDDSWRVVQKDGTTLRFGQTNDSKEASDTGTYLWNLTKVIDNNSNYIELTYYIKEGGKSYLHYIDYTGNDTTGASPTNRVEFTLEDRTDITSSYIFGSEIKTAKRLSKITVENQGSLVWSYELKYDYSADTHRSLLKNITQSASDGTSMPEQTFNYQSNQ
jgi:hypothetical protein